MQYLQVPNFEEYSVFIENFRSIYSELKIKNISGIEANERMFSLILSDFPTSVLVSITQNISADYIKSKKFQDYVNQIYNQSISNDLVEYIIKNPIPLYDIKELMGANVKYSLPPEVYFKQIQSVGKLLPIVLELNTGVNSIVEVFSGSEEDNLRWIWRYIRWCNDILGYYSSDFPGYDKSNYWPSEYDYSLSESYIDYYKGDDFFKNRNIYLVSRTVDMTDSELIYFYAWNYSPSFEFFLTSSSVPDDLPPWIRNINPRLAELHKNINSKVMTSFEEEALSMEEELDGEFDG